MGIIVICSYRPKDGQANQLAALLQRHVPTLREQGLASDLPAHHMRAADGTVLELFEWLSQDHSRQAQSNPVVQKLWGEFALVCDFVPLADLAEAKRPFAHFTPLA